MGNVSLWVIGIAVFAIFMYFTRWPLVKDGVTQSLLNRFAYLLLGGLGFARCCIYHLEVATEIGTSWFLAVVQTALSGSHSRPREYPGPRWCCTRIQPYQLAGWRDYFDINSTTVETHRLERQLCQLGTSLVGQVLRSHPHDGWAKIHSCRAH